MLKDAYQKLLTLYEECDPRYGHRSSPIAILDALRNFLEFDLENVLDEMQDAIGRIDELEKGVVLNVIAGCDEEDSFLSA